MKLFTIIKYATSHLPAALTLAWPIVLCACLAEGLQHVAEWHLGMYASKDAFTAQQGNSLRIGFGILKVTALLAATYFVPKALFKAFGPPPKYGSFNKDMLRKLWDPRGGMTGFFAMLILAAPLIALHYGLSYLAMGHSLAVPLLVIDSLLVGAIAAVMGTAVWAGDKVEAEQAETLV